MEGIAMSLVATTNNYLVNVGCLMAIQDDDPWADEPITGPYPELAKKVRDITGRVPSRSAGFHAGVSHDTIQKLWQGHRANEMTLIRFAIGYAVNANDLLKLAGYPLLSEKEMRETSKYGSGEIERQSEDQEFYTSFDNLPIEDKEFVREMVARMHKNERKKSIGGRGK